MRQQSKKQVFELTVTYEDGKSKKVSVKATSYDKAIERARKFHPAATLVR